MRTLDLVDLVDPHNPRTIYVGTARGVRGVSSVTGGAVSLAPDAAAVGPLEDDRRRPLVHAGVGRRRHGPRRQPRRDGQPRHDLRRGLPAGHLALLERRLNLGAGLRVADVGERPPAPSSRSTRPRTATPASTSATAGPRPPRDGPFGVPASNSGVYRGDAVDTKTSARDELHRTNRLRALTARTTDPTGPTYDYCEGQCWYDNYVVSPAGHPDIVYVGGSFDYNFYSRSTPAGRAALAGCGADVGRPDARQRVADDRHPPRPALPRRRSRQPAALLRGLGRRCRPLERPADRRVGATAARATARTRRTARRCSRRVPTKMTTLNNGLSTLQFQSAVRERATARPDRRHAGQRHLARLAGASSTWNQTIYGDGGVAGFDSQNPSIMLNEFYDQASDVNFENGDPSAWVIASAPVLQLGRGLGVLQATARRPGRRRHAVRRPPARLADAGRRWRQEYARGELPRVHRLREHAGLRRLGRSGRSVRRRRPGHPG